MVGDKDSSGNAWPGLISAHKDLPPLYKEDWEKVWATCGGNIQLLGVCVADVSVYGDWGKGKILKVIHSRSMVYRCLILTETHML